MKTRRVVAVGLVAVAALVLLSGCAFIMDLLGLGGDEGSVISIGSVTLSRNGDQLDNVSFTLNVSGSTPPASVDFEIFYSTDATYSADDLVVYAGNALLPNPINPVAVYMATEIAPYLSANGITIPDGIYSVGAHKINTDGNTAVIYGMAPDTITVVSTFDLALGGFDTWRSQSLGASQVAWFHFPALEGSSYGISWDDEFDGSGAYGLDVRVAAYRADMFTPYFTDADSGWGSPTTIVALATEDVYVKVEAYYAGDAGDFALMVSPPAVWTSLGVNGGWSSGTLAAYDVIWYTIAVTGGQPYTIYWDDSYQGSATYTADVEVYAVNSDLTVLLTTEDSGYTGHSFNAAQSGTAYVVVRDFGAGADIGDFAVQVTQP